MQQKTKRNTQTDPLEFTLSYQLMKSTEELLAEALASGYEGYVKIIATLDHGDSHHKNQVLLDVRLEKLGPSTGWSQERLRKQCSDQICAVFDLVQGKGCKRILV